MKPPFTFEPLMLPSISPFHLLKQTSSSFPAALVLHVRYPEGKSYGPRTNSYFKQLIVVNAFIQKVEIMRSAGRMLRCFCRFFVCDQTDVAIYVISVAASRTYYLCRQASTYQPFRFRSRQNQGRSQTFSFEEATGGASFATRGAVNGLCRTFRKRPEKFWGGQAKFWGAVAPLASP